MADLINRVVRFHEFGPGEVLRVENAEVREPGPGEVRIKVAAIGLNFAETLWRRNQYFESPTLPAGLGYRTCRRRCTICGSNRSNSIST